LLARFRSAARAIVELPYARRVQRSPLYRSEPIGPVADQPAFTNAVVVFELRAACAASAILADLLAIEDRLGRRRDQEVAQGPRPIDLDLLAVGAAVEDRVGPPALILPHPRMGERAFVLRPLADLLGGDFVLPATGWTIAQRLAAPKVAAQCLRKLSESFD